MKRPQYVFRPDLSDPQHRRAWALLQQTPSARRKEFLVQAILAAEQTDVKVCKVNIDEEPGLAQRFGVMSIPTVVLFENGQEKNRSVGLVPKEKLLALLGR